MKLTFVLAILAAIAVATPVPAKGQGSTPAAGAASPAAQHGAGKGGKGSGTGAAPPASSTAAVPPATTSSASASSSSSSTTTKGPVNPAQVPQFGVTAGQDPQGGTCAGTNAVRIPCTCPPSRDAFIAKLNQFVQAGNAFGTATPFPSDNSKASQITRIQTSIITLQNFNGAPGKGCPAASTTFLAQKAAL